MWTMKSLIALIECLEYKYQILVKTMVDSQAKNIRDKSRANRKYDCVLFSRDFISQVLANYLLPESPTSQ